MSFRALDQVDPDVAQLIRNEFRRQSDTLELIASENLTSPAILEALGTLLTNKYAEGYPGRRYYGGTGEVIDKIETLAVERAKQLFGADYVNVQPHSGSQANAAVYMAVCQPGDRVMGMDLSAGGHLTHGSPANFSGKLYEIHSYGVDRETERIDYDSVQKLAEEVRPKMLLAGFSAYSRVVDWARMREIADSVGAVLFVDMAHVAGLVAGGVYPSPIPHARRPAAPETHGQAGAGHRRHRGHHAQPQLDPVRRRVKVQPERGARRHAPGDDPRHARAGDGHHRGLHRRRDRAHRRPGDSGFGPRAGAGVVPEVPDPLRV